MKAGEGWSYRKVTWDGMEINNNCQIFIEKTDSIAGRQKEIIPHVSAYYVDKYTTISEKGVKTGSNRLCGTANQELLAGYMLYKYLGISSDEQLVRNEHGKPEIAAGYKNESAAFFNLAHSAHMWCLQYQTDLLAWT